jgi:hypothetical protein
MLIKNSFILFLWFGILLLATCTTQPDMKTLINNNGESSILSDDTAQPSSPPIRMYLGSQDHLLQWGYSFLGNPFVPFRPTFGKARYQVYAIGIRFAQNGRGRVLDVTSYDINDQTTGIYMNAEAFQDFLRKNAPHSDESWEAVSDVINRVVPPGREYPFRADRLYILPIVLPSDVALPVRVDVYFEFNGKTYSMHLPQ